VSFYGTPASCENAWQRPYVYHDTVRSLRAPQAGRLSIPRGFQPKKFNQRDLPYVHHTRGWRSQDETPRRLGLSDQSRRDPSCNALHAAI
jgi:hypothetical protein